MKISPFATKKIPNNIIIALKATSAFRMRSLITSSGIIVGIAYLVCLLAAQNGLNHYLKVQEKIIGKNNLIILPETFSKFETLEKLESDARSIKEIIPVVENTCARISFDVNVNYEFTQKQASLSGVSEDYCSVFHIKILEGQMFSDIHFLNSKSVCLISSDLKNSLFSGINPIDKWVKCDDLYLQVIGVFQANKTALSSRNSALNLQNSVLAPYRTVEFRLSNPEIIAQRADHSVRSIIVHLKNAYQVDQSEEIIERILLRRHNNIKDFKIINPLQILENGLKNRRMAILIFTLVTVLCLFTSGIGIMNYITASGYERMNEIKIQLSKGKSIRDILMQFLFQAINISFFGGLLGIIIGIICTKIFYDYTKFIMIVSFSSILISFAVSVLIGIIFAYIPAKNTINDLRKNSELI